VIQKYEKLAKGKDNTPLYWDIHPGSNNSGWIDK
jgi:hypothetical protein